MNRLTPAESAAFTFRLAGHRADPDALAARFRSDAADWHDMAEKALTSPTGKYRGHTAAELRAVATDLDARATSVPAELRKLLGGTP